MWANVAALAALLTLQSWWIGRALDAMGARLDRLDGRVTARLDRLEDRMTGVEAAVSALGERVGALERERT